MDLIQNLSPAVIAGAAIAVLLLIVIISGYVKASPNTAYIISGFRGNPRILIGKAGIKIPYLVISLHSMSRISWMTRA